MPAHPGQERDDHRHADDGVGQQEHRVRVLIGGDACHRRVHTGRRGHSASNDESDLGRQHVAGHPAGHAADLAQLGAAEIEPRPPPEPDLAQRGDQRQGLDDDTQRGADTEQHHTTAQNRGRCAVQAHGGHEQPSGEGRHHRYRAERQHCQREHPLAVRVAPVGMLTGRPDKQRHYDAGENARTGDRFRPRPEALIRLS
jgi:hypothetical protein